MGVVYIIGHMSVQAGSIVGTDCTPPQFITTELNRFNQTVHGNAWEKATHYIVYELGPELYLDVTGQQMLLYIA
jgi:hypothetical protein